MFKTMPDQMDKHLEKICQSSMLLLKYDPECPEDVEEEEEAAEEDGGSDDGSGWSEATDEDPMECSPEDPSFKVRRAAIKVFQAIVVTRADKRVYFSGFGKDVISRFSAERMPDVKVLVMQTIQRILQANIETR